MISENWPGQKTHASWVLTFFYSFIKILLGYHLINVLKLFLISYFWWKRAYIKLELDCMENYICAATLTTCKLFCNMWFYCTWVYMENQTMCSLQWLAPSHLIRCSPWIDTLCYKVMMCVKSGDCVELGDYMLHVTYMIWALLLRICEAFKKHHMSQLPQGIMHQKLTIMCQYLEIIQNVCDIMPEMHMFFQISCILCTNLQVKLKFCLRYPISNTIRLN